MKHWWMGILFFAMMVPAMGQSKKSLEQKRAKLIRDIELTTSQISKNKKNSELAIQDLRLISSQLSKRRELLNVMQKEKELLESRRNTLVDSVKMLQTSLSNQKQDYAKVLNQAHIRARMKHPFQSLVEGAAIFEGFKRWIYLGQLKSFVVRKWNSLQNSIVLMSKRQSELESTIVEQKSLLTDLTSEEARIAKEKKQKDQLVDKLKSDKKKLESDLKRKQRQRNEINKQIEKLILAELAKRKKASADRSEVDIVLSNNFKENKGKLPWPVNNGVITSRFGKHAHPILRGVYTDNSGVDFLVKDYSSIKSVFAGEVVGTTQLPGQDYMVIVSHGNYFTVYSKLSRVDVKVGQKIERGDLLGKATASRDGNSNLHFEVWQEKAKKNPQLWLRN